MSVYLPSIRPNEQAFDLLTCPDFNCSPVNFLRRRTHSLSCIVPHSLEQAFAYNFLSAMSAILGTIIILALGGEMTGADISVILLIGAGSFIFIALAELMPEALRVNSSLASGAVLPSQARKLLSFLLGALLIGIPLIFDQHCAADGHDH